MAFHDPSLVIDRRAELGAAAGVHALLIGISDYKYLPDIDALPTEGGQSLRKLRRSAVTASRIMRKLIELNERGRLIVPLKTVRLLVSPSAAELKAEPGLGSLPGDSQHEAIGTALRAWQDDVSQAEDNQTWFFFSGHLARLSRDDCVLLPSDFMQPDSDLLSKTFRCSDIQESMPFTRSEKSLTQIYFLDSSDSPIRPFHELAGQAETPLVLPRPPGTGPTRAPVFIASRSTRMAMPDTASELTSLGEALSWGLDNGVSASRKMASERAQWPVTASSLHTAIGQSERWARDFDLELVNFVFDPVICLGKAPSQSGVELPAATSERLNTQRDNPAKVDALGRHWFARILATRIVEAHVPAAEDSPAFMVHLHGPWGSGKSSVLNFVEQELKSGELGSPWLVVDFNAWKHQRLRPPWWSLIRSVYSAALKDPQVKSNLRLRSVWWQWRLRADWLPILLVALVLGGAAFAITRMGGGDKVLPSIAAAITAAAGVYGYARFLLFGSSKAAQTYLDIRDDPFGPVIKLLNDLVSAIGRPVIVFIDDLDRCDSDYVVELLEGIQTLQRSAPITYLVAADRKWICSSIEKKYSDFAGTIGEAGRPLGYLFLDKMFQISVGIPRLSSAIQARYWRQLLSPADGSQPDARAVEEARAKAAREVEGLTSQEDLQRVVDKHANESPVVQQAIREQAALQITSAAATLATEHKLQKLAGLLEPNPRAMKRLVNAVALAQASAFLEGRSADLDLLARWAMIELRWPVLADLLATNPELIEPFQQVHQQPAGAGENRLFPPHVADLGRDRDLLSIIAPAEGSAGLDCAALKDWLA